MLILEYYRLTTTGVDQYKRIKVYSEVRRLRLFSSVRDPISVRWVPSRWKSRRSTSPKLSTKNLACGTNQYLVQKWPHIQARSTRWFTLFIPGMRWIPSFGKRAEKATFDWGNKLRVCSIASIILTATLMSLIVGGGNISDFLKNTLNGTLLLPPHFKIFRWRARKIRVF